MTFTALSDLVDVAAGDQARAVVQLSRRPSAGRWQVEIAPSPYPTTFDFSLVPTERCGEAPTQYNVKFLFALLGAQHGVSGTVVNEALLREFPVPAIDFAIDEYVRRSMTLNSMRMSTEYHDSGSMRVLQLVDQRLDAGHAAVVHDVLVYNAQRIIDTRAAAAEARALRAESLAAYLGLAQDTVAGWLQAKELNAPAIARRITAGEAGPLRRALDVPALVDSQLRLLRPQLKACDEQEDTSWRLIDKITEQLTAAAH